MLRSPRSRRPQRAAAWFQTRAPARDKGSRPASKQNSKRWKLRRRAGRKRRAALRLGRLQAGEDALDQRRLLDARDHPKLPAAAAGGAVLVTPLLVLSDRQSGALGWIPRPSLADLEVLFHDYFGPSLVVGVLLVICVIVAVLPGGHVLPGGPVPAWWRRPGVSLPSATRDSAKSPMASHPTR